MSWAGCPASATSSEGPGRWACGAGERSPVRQFDVGRGVHLGVNTLVVAFLLAPIAIVAVFAVNPTPFIQFPPVGISPRWFQKFLASRDFMSAIRLSLGVAGLVAVLATTLRATAAPAP